MAERIRSVIADEPVVVQGVAIAVTVSFGAITIENTNRIEEMTMEAILAKADECLYRAKEAGRNRVVAVQF